jgi:hypothetical protein
MVDPMRENHRLNRPRVAFRHRRTAWLLLASLLGLFLSQSFHAPAMTGTAGRGGAATAAASLLASDGAPQHPAHDADACPVCRATTQTRLGLRAPAHANALAANGPELRLCAPLTGPSKLAPELACAHPRAPPTPTSDLSV